MYGDGDVRGTKYELILLNARALLQSDLGEVNSLSSNEILTESFVQEMEKVHRLTDVHSIAGLFYNFSASIIHQTIPASKPNARASFSAHDSTLRISKGIKDNYVAGTVLVHEARHLWVSHQPCSWNQKRSCDGTPSGAYGYGMAAKLLAWKQTDDLEGATELEQSIRRLFNRIESFNDEHGDLLPEWRTVDLSTF